MEEIYSKLTDVLQDIFDNDDLEATPTLSASDVAGWDSLAHVRLVLAIERAFGVGFSAAEIASFQTVGDVAKTIAAKR